MSEDGVVLLETPKIPDEVFEYLRQMHEDIELVTACGAPLLFGQALRKLKDGRQ